MHPPSSNTALSRRTVVGIAGTVVWLGLMAALAYAKRADLGRLTLADWGTFLGGIVGPVAFLWLILGYFQQGEELRLNTQALRLQGEELRNQVKETAALARHTEAQVKIATDALDLERQREVTERETRRRKSRLVLRSTGGIASVNSGELRLENAGGRARRLRVSAAPPVEVTISPTDALATGGGGVIYFSKVQSFPILIELRYIDEHDAEQKTALEVRHGGAFVQKDEYDV